VVDAIARVRRVSRTLPLLAVVTNAASPGAGAAWLAGADEVASVSAVAAGMALEGLDEVRHPERDALRRLQRLWHAGPSDPLRQALASRLATRFRDVGLTAEGLVGLTTQDVESPQAAALVVNASADADTLVLGVRRVKRTYPGLSVAVVAETGLHDAFRRAGADECLAPSADPDAVLHAVARAQAACRATLDLDSLRAKETRLRALLEHLPEAVMLVSPEHAVLAVNLAALRLIGAQDARQVLGSPLEPWLDLGEAPVDGAVQLLDGVAAGGTRELLIRTRHLAEPRRLLLRAVPFQRESGGAPAALIVLRDAPDAPTDSLVVPAVPALDAVLRDEREAWQAERTAWSGAQEKWAAERTSLLARVDALALEAQAQIEQARAALADLDARAQASADALARAAQLDALGITPDTLPTLVDAAARLAVLEQQEVPALLARAQAQEQAHDGQLARIREMVAGLEALREERDAALDAARTAEARAEELEAQLTLVAATPADASPTSPQPEPMPQPAPGPASVTAVQRWLLEDIARVGLVRTDADGHIIDANDQAARLCGFADAAALRSAGHLPAEITSLADEDTEGSARFETCLQVADAAPHWIAGARLAADGDDDDVTWLLAETTHAPTTASGMDPAALLEALADECLAIVDDPPAVPRGPRALDASPDTDGAGATALARARVLLAQLSSCRRRRQEPVALDDLATHLPALDLLLARLATDDIGWTASYPSVPVHVPVAPADVERCLTGAVAAMREALPLGGQIAMRVDMLDRCEVEGAGQPTLRPGVEICLDAEGYGVQAPTVPQGVRDLVARVGGTLIIHDPAALSVRLTVRLPRAVVIARAA
jgi:PAS domain-containing protein